jgi:hypothetical protein
MQKYSLVPLQRNDHARLVQNSGAGVDKAEFWGVPIGSSGECVAVLLNRKLWTQVESLTAANWEGARDLCGGIFELTTGDGFITRPAVAVLRNKTYEVTSLGALELPGKKMT